MAHGHFPDSYWTKPWNDNPGTGNAGTANGSYGFSESDFELPLFMFGNGRDPNDKLDGEPGLVGKLCTKNTLSTCGQLNQSDFANKFYAPSYAYTGRSTYGSVQSPNTFYTWFHDTDRTIPIPYTFTLTKNNDRTYSFHKSPFFPIDDQGWKDQGKASDGSYHNFAFCAAMHSLFGYQGGETFSFQGDDDVFVYLGGYLVIDIGGIHGAKDASVSLDDLGFLDVGNTYSFDMFYCERHTVASDILITTSLQFQCPADLLDWCGVCGGDGSSCCTGDALKKCTDKNACTSDACGKDNTCVNTPIPCNPNNACDTAVCDPVNGCQHSPLPCVPDACHTAKCVPDAGGCVFTEKPCPTDNLCYDSSCDPVHGCMLTPKANVCPESDLCTQYTCQNSTGACIKKDIGHCDDNNVCTDDQCDPKTGKCTNKDITATLCNDNKLCTLDVCDPTNGCSHPPVVCSGNDCQTATCNANTGKCDVQNLTCADSSGCTVGSCKPRDKCSTPQKSCSGTENCTYIPKDCSTGTACLTSTCDMDTGDCTKPVSVNPDGFCLQCANAPNGVCTWDDPCNPQTCNDQGHCVTEPFTCSDPNKCSTSSCKNMNGTATCVPATKPCDPSLAADQCTPLSCDPVLGCRNLTSRCEDLNPCTVDTCVGPDNCTNIVPANICDDKDACTMDMCNAGFSTLTQACNHTNITCPSLGECKVNTMCHPVNGCMYEDKVCPQPDDVCQVAHCDPVGGCIAVNKTCVVDDPGCFIGVCEPVNGTCTQTKRGHWTSNKSTKSGKTCFLTYNKGAAVAAITAGAAAGIAIGGAAAIGLIGFGGKKGYDLWQAHAQTMNHGVSENPLYTPSENAGTNPLYGTDA